MAVSICDRHEAAILSRSWSALVGLSWLALLGVLLSLVVVLRPAAAVPLVKQPATEVTVQLGSPAGDLKFFPSDLTFEAGKRYKLILKNPSPQKHYFTAKDFADGIWSQKVDAGNVEVKGAIHELELRPETEAKWVFVALKPGTYGLRCTIAGHAEAGMTGTIKIS